MTPQDKHSKVMLMKQEYWDTPISFVKILKHGLQADYDETKANDTPNAHLRSSKMAEGDFVSQQELHGAKGIQE